MLPVGVLEDGVDHGVGQPVAGGDAIEAGLGLVEGAAGGAQPHAAVAVALDLAQAARQVHGHRLEGAVGEPPDPLPVPGATDPQASGGVLPDGVAAGVRRQALRLCVAVEAAPVVADQVIEGEPEVAPPVLGDPPALVGPARRRRLSVALHVPRHEVVVLVVVEVPQGPGAGAPEAGLGVLEEELHRPVGDALSAEVVKPPAVVPADAAEGGEPQTVAAVLGDVLGAHAGEAVGQAEGAPRASAVQGAGGDDGGSLRHWMGGARGLSLAASR